MVFSFHGTNYFGAGVKNFWMLEKEPELGI